MSFFAALRISLATLRFFAALRMTWPGYFVNQHNRLLLLLAYLQIIHTHSLVARFDK